MLIIDQYSYTNDLKDKNPLAKTYFALGFLCLGFLINHRGVYLSIFIMNLLIITFLAKIPIKKYIKILTFPMTFLILGILPVLLSLSLEGEFFMKSISLGGITIGITQGGMSQSVLLMVRAMSSISCTFMLILTTPMNDLIIVLKKHKVPTIAIEMMVLIYRFIFILLEEANTILVAQKLKLGYQDTRKSCESLSLLIASLFIRVLNRCKALEYSLEARGFDREFHL